MYVGGKAARLGRKASEGETLVRYFSSCLSFSLLFSSALIFLLKCISSFDLLSSTY